MKKLFILIIVCVLYSHQSYSQKCKYGVNLNYITDAYNMDLPVGVYGYIEESFLFERKFGENIPTNERVSIGYCIFDKHGFLTRNGPSETYKNTYSPDGRILEIDAYSDSVFVWKKKYRYEQDGVIWVTYDRDGKELCVEGQDSKHRYYRGNGLSDRDITLDKYGKAIKISAIADISLRYNTKHYMVSSTISGFGHSETTLYDGYKYDSRGVWISRFITKGGKPHRYEKRQIFYSEKAAEKLIKEVEDKQTNQ